MIRSRRQGLGRFFGWSTRDDWTGLDGVIWLVAWLQSGVDFKDRENGRLTAGQKKQ